MRLSRKAKPKAEAAARLRTHCILESAASAISLTEGHMNIHRAIAIGVLMMGAGIHPAGAQTDLRGKA